MDISDYDHNCAHNYVKSYFLRQLWFFINVYIYVCMCMNVCMYVCIYVCVYVCIYVYMYVFVYACCIRIYVGLYDVCNSYL